MLLKYLIIHLKCFHDILSDLGVNKLLYLLIAIVNSLLEKRFHNECCLDRRFSNKELLTYWLCTKLNIR